MKTQLIKGNRKEVAKYLETKRNHGAIMFGDVGVGKTYLLRRPRMVSASELAMEFQASGIEKVKGIINDQIKFQGLNVVIDDLGTEEDVKHFGNGLDPIAFVIQKIYDINQRIEQEDHKIKLWMTTNYEKDFLTKKYGVRVIDRLWEMCDRIILKDTNLRKEDI